MMSHLVQQIRVRFGWPPVKGRVQAMAEALDAAYQRHDEARTRIDIALDAMEIRRVH